MSDEFNNDGPKDPKDKTKESDFDRDQKKAPLLPTNEDLFNFLDALFTGEGEFPERIDVRTVKGRNKDQYGVQIKQFPYKSGSTKPNRERLVMMSNEIINRIRIHTDTLQRDTTYMIGAYNSGRSDDFYEIMTISARPSKKWRNSGEGHGEPGDDDEEESLATKQLAMQLDNNKEMFRLVGGMIEGLIDRSDRQAQSAFIQLEKAQLRNIELLEVNMKLVQADDERQERREKSKMWRENISKGIELAWQNLPPMLASMKGPNANANWTPGTESPEANTLRDTLFKVKEEGGKISQADFETICGKLDDNGMLTVAGILTPEQVQLLMRVATKEANPDALDELLPGGSLAVTSEQGNRLIQTGALEALMPLKLLLEQQMAKRAARQAQQPTGESK